MWIPEVRHAWRYASVKISAVAAAVMALLATDPTVLLGLLNSMPAPLRYLIPEQILAIISAIIFAATLYFRLRQQPKVERKIRARLKEDARK